MRNILVLFFILIPNLVVAQTNFPKNLGSTDREQVAKIIGFGLGTKMLSNPYPLGGYEGYEFGVSTEFISLDSIASLGDGSSDKGEFTIYNFSVGKGLFYNIDLFVHFAPPFQQENIGSYGAQVRWGFWESRDLPMIASLLVSGGGSQVQSLINSNTVATDVVIAMNIEDLSLYFGGGMGRVITRFTGGAAGLTNDGNSHQVDLLEAHSLFGLSVQVDRMFVAFQMDRFVDSVYSAKIGYRF